MRAGHLSRQFARAGPPASLSFAVRHDKDTDNSIRRHRHDQFAYLSAAGVPDLRRGSHRSARLVHASRNHYRALLRSRIESG